MQFEIASGLGDSSIDNVMRRECFVYAIGRQVPVIMMAQVWVKLVLRFERRAIAPPT